MRFRLLDLLRILNFLPELEDIAVVVADGKLAHAIEEIFDWVHHAGFVFDPLPQPVVLK